MLITRKIEIHISAENDQEQKETRKRLWNIAAMTRKAANSIMTHQVLTNVIKTEMVDASFQSDLTDKAEIKKVRNDLFKAKNKELEDILGTSLKNSSYQMASLQFPDLPSDIRTCLNQSVVKQFYSDLSDLAKGEVSVRQYKNNLPIPFSKTSMRNWRESDDTFIFDWLTKISFKLFFGRDRSNNRVIIERCLEGQKKLNEAKEGNLSDEEVEKIKSETYQFCASSIQLVKDENKKEKTFLLLCVEIPQTKNQLDPNIKVGVNLGLIVPAYVVCPSTKAKKALGSYEELLLPRLGIQEQRRKLQKAMSLGVERGKGRKKILKKLDDLKIRERNYVKTVNHNISKEVIKFALENSAGTIILEDLEGFDKSEFCLRNWSYYEAQQFIQYKAKLEGILIQWIKPYNHTVNCYLCGSEGEKNFKLRTNKCSNPECKNHEKPIHIDFNAAMNNVQKSDIVEI